VASRADEYRRRAFEAQRYAARATDAILKAGFERLAQRWLALAKQAELRQRRYGFITVLQQQQIQRPSGLLPGYTAEGARPPCYDVDQEGQSVWTPHFAGRQGSMAMQDHVDQPPIVRCPGCQQAMEAKERTSVADNLVDVCYVCPTCGMETRRILKEDV
jgi:hypothetical protein